MHNLVSNAISFTPPGGSIEVQVRKQDGEATVCVADTGVGLTAEQLGKLFQAFSRPHEGTGVPKGTGLGLFIVFVEHGHASTQVVAVFFGLALLFGVLHDTRSIDRRQRRTIA